MMATAKYFKFVVLMFFVGIVAVCQIARSRALPAVTRAQAEKDPLPCAQYLASKLPSSAAENDLFSDLSLRASRLGFGEKSLRLVGRSAARPSERRDDYYEKLRMIEYASTDASVDSVIATLNLIPEGETKDRRLVNIVQTAVNANLASKAASIVSLIQSPYCRAKAMLILSHSLNSTQHASNLVGYVDTALKAALSDEYRSDAVALLPEIANGFLDLGQTDKALRTLRQSEEAADQLDSNRALDLLSETAETFLRVGRTDEVLRIADKMMQLPNSDVSLEMLSQKCGEKKYCELGEHIANGIRDPMTGAMTLVNMSHCYSLGGLSFHAARLLSTSTSLASQVPDAGSQVDLLTMVAEIYCTIDGKEQALAALLIAEHIAAKIKDNFEENGLFASREEYRGEVAEAYLHCGYPAEAARVFDSMTDAYLINQIIDRVSSSLESAGRSSEADAIRALTRREPVAETHPAFAWNPLAEDSARGRRADSLLLLTANRSVDGGYLAKSPAACSLDVMIDSWYGKTLDMPVLIRLAQYYVDLADSARAKRAIINIFAQYHAILGGSDDDTLLTKIVSICEHLGSECGAFALIPDTDYVACEVELLALAEIYCKQGDWQKCIRYASDLTSRDKKLIVFAAIAGWYYILQPDTGNKQTDFLRKLVTASEK